jgi:hypothetical protein
MTWLDHLMTVTKESESPRKYYYWAGMSAIAAVVKNQVYLDKFYYKLYPNIYVLLVGKSGIRKGPPVALAKRLVTEVGNTRVISGRASIQAIITELQKAKTSDNGGPPLTDASGFLTTSEFASFIIQDQQALTILTDLYDGDYNPEWVNLTKGSGQEKLKNPCLTMIGASNEIHFKDAVPDNALGGGFVARTCIIHADRKSIVNPLTSKPKEDISIPELAKYLKVLSQLSGQFKYSDGAREIYNKWYEEFSDGEYSDTTGTIERLHDHILKAAMLISLSRKVNLVLEEEDVQEAIIACQDFVPGARKVSMGGGKSITSVGTATFLKELLSRKEHGYAMTRVKMLNKHWADFDSYELDRIAESLEAQKAITIKLISLNGLKKEIVYVLTPAVVENYSKMQKEES